MKLEPESTAFVFPGQGSQALGMGKDLVQHYPAAKQIFEQADSELGFPLSKVMWDGPEADLNDTINTQPALYVHSLAAYKIFVHLFPDFKPAVLAGHSLGELSALAVAGALSFDDGLRLVRRRGELMKRAGEQSPGGMAAILGLDISLLEEICAEVSTDKEIVQVANDNCPGQVVISGSKSAIERAIPRAKAAGAKRALPLAVSIAAHSPLMASIQSDWNSAVRAATFNDLNIPIMGNVHPVRFSDAASARLDIMEQMQSRVRWTESILALVALGIKTFVEVGSGSVLMGLIKRIAAEQSLNGITLGNQKDIENIIQS